MQASVDDLLIAQMTGKPTEAAPVTIEVQNVPHETSVEPKVAAQEPQVEPVSASKSEVADKKPEKSSTNEYGDESIGNPEQLESETNEYGLETETPKTYTKAEMDAYANQLMRERVARFERNNQQHQPTQQQQSQAQQQGFQYDENSNLDWQQQLETFVMQVADKREQHKTEQLQRAIEQENLAAFESKFKDGMEKFKDYHHVVKGKHVTDAMLMAASDISDPAALFYAAAKRMPEELAKIADIKNPYSQAAAIGRLDEKLKKQANRVSNAPKPVSQTKADTTAPSFQPKPTTGNELDDLLVSNNAQRVALLNSRRR